MRNLHGIGIKSSYGYECKPWNVGTLRCSHASESEDLSVNFREMRFQSFEIFTPVYKFIRRENDVDLRDGIACTMARGLLQVGQTDYQWN